MKNKEQCDCIAQSTGKQCHFSATHQINSSDICGRHFAILQRRKRVKVKGGYLVKKMGSFFIE